MEGQRPEHLNFHEELRCVSGAEGMDSFSIQTQDLLEVGKYSTDVGKDN